MKQVLAIAGLALRTAVRSRVVLSLLVLLALIVVGLPLTIKGDGTLEGYIRILLTYTLGCTVLVLTLATLWSGCSALATDIDDKVIQLTVTKPVHPVRIWFGKWLGLMALNTVLLAACGAITYVLLTRGVHSTRISEADRERVANALLVARQSVVPPAPDVRADAESRYEAALRDGQLPDGHSRSDAIRLLEQSLLQQAFTVRNGQERRWRIDLPRPLRAGESVTLRFRFRVSQEEDQTVAGLWTLAPAGATAGLRLPVDTTAGGFHDVRFRNALLDGVRQLDVAFANVDDLPVSVAFDPANGIQLLLDEGGFEANLVRALAVLLAYLAFAAALGITLGSCFSLPVAVFFSLFVTGLLQFGSYIRSMAAESLATPEGASGWTTLLVAAIHRAVAFVIAPFQAPNPLESIATGQLVSWTWVAHAFAWQGLIAVALLALLGGFVLRRRELALPSA